MRPFGGSASRRVGRGGGDNTKKQEGARKDRFGGAQYSRGSRNTAAASMRESALSQGGKYAIAQEKPPMRSGGLSGRRRCDGGAITASSRKENSHPMAKDHADENRICATG